MKTQSSPGSLASQTKDIHSFGSQSTEPPEDQNTSSLEPQHTLDPPRDQDTTRMDLQPSSDPLQDQDTTSLEPHSSPDTPEHQNTSNLELEASSDPPQDQDTTSLKPHPSQDQPQYQDTNSLKSQYIADQSQDQDITSMNLHPSSDLPTTIQHNQCILDPQPFSDSSETLSHDEGITATQSQPSPDPLQNLAIPNVDPHEYTYFSINAPKHQDTAPLNPQPSTDLPQFSQKSQVTPPEEIQPSQNLPASMAHEQGINKLTPQSSSYLPITEPQDEKICTLKSQPDTSHDQDFDVKEIKPDETLQALTDKSRLPNYIHENCTLIQNVGSYDYFRLNQVRVYR